MSQSEESMYCLPQDEAVSKFLERRAEYLAEIERWKLLLVKSIKDFAVLFEGRVDTAQKANLDLRCCLLNTTLLPLRHRYDMHKYFPCLVLKLPESFASNCYVWDSDKLLKELKDAIQSECDAAVAEVQK